MTKMNSMNSEANEMVNLLKNFDESMQKTQNLTDLEKTLRIREELILRKKLARTNSTISVPSRNIVIEEEENENIGSGRNTSGL